MATQESDTNSESLTISFKIAPGLNDELNAYLKETNMAKNRSELINHLIWQLINDHKKYKLMIDREQDVPNSGIGTTKQAMPINIKRATKKTE